MSVLDNFVEEMLQVEVPKRVLLERMLHGLEVGSKSRHSSRYRHRSTRLNPICMACAMIIRRKKSLFRIK